MLSEEKNRLLTEVGPDKPMGNLLRRYWHPVAGASEFENKNIRPIRLFGEDLVLFKSLTGEYGLISRRCAHRGSDLSFGIVEETGLRCAYHGWQYNKQGTCTHRPFDEVAAPSASGRPISIANYQVREKAGMLWAYMGPSPAPELPDWDAFNWKNCFSQVVIAEIPCNWLQCQENTVDPVHFEWMHNNGPQRRAGDLGPYSPRTLKVAIEDTEYGLISRRFREGTDESTPLWKVGRAVLWPNGWYFGHHFEWKVPVDDHNTLFITWSTLHVPREREPYTQQRIPTWYAPIKDESGQWIISHVGNQDIVAWISQGSIADRTRELLGASDVGVVALRRRLLEDMERMSQGLEPRALIRNPEMNKNLFLPCLAHEDLMNGLPLEQMMAHSVMGPFLRDYYSMAGQPDEIRLEFEAAMGVSQSSFEVHTFVPK